MREATITINGQTLTMAQSSVIRCCIAQFLTDLADPKYRAELGEIADGYRSRASEIQHLIIQEIAPTHGIDAAYRRATTP